MTLLLLSLPGSPPTLLISLYCPPHDTCLREIISEALDVLLPKYPSHIIGGDFNTSINFSLDTKNITSSNAWPWLSNKVNKQPPALHDTFRDKHPHVKKFSRYWSTNHQNQARLDYIFASPQFTSTHPILDADIETSNFFSGHHPAFITCSAPVIPSLATQSQPAPIFRRLSQDEIHQFEHFLSPLNKWLKAIQPSIEHLSQDEVFSLTTFITSDISMAYHHITRILVNRTTKEEKKFSKLARFIPSPDHPNFAKSVRELEKLVSEWSADIQKTHRNKLHRALLAGTAIKRTLAETLQPQPSTFTAVTEPANNTIHTSPASISKAFCNTLQHLGGDPSFEPDQKLLTSLLQHLPTCPDHVPSSKLPPLEEQRFIEILKRSKPSKRGGTDGSNLYMIFLSPEYVRRWFLFATNFSLTHTMPPNFTESQVFLLYKKGDTRWTSNYRPISLLNSLYKLVSTHLVDQLSSHTLTHKLLHPSQHGGLPCHRTADHIHHITALQSRNTPAYHLYIDFNKAFNSIPRSALWSTLIHYNLPSQLITALQMLYHSPKEIPLINGETHHHFTLLRGVKQGCPLSPLLFNLYINIILWALPQHVSILHSDTTHTFIDDFLFRTTSPTTAAAVFNFFDQEGRQLRLDMNISKTELHAVHGASPVTICTPSKASLSTHSPNGTPHTYYKYI